MRAVKMESDFTILVFIFGRLINVLTRSKTYSVDPKLTYQEKKRKRLVFNEKNDQRFLLTL